ncbi:tetratricopeptide repeat-containing protein [Mycena vulgaris]|nr:tetratricopeptide repeat-containing protein [Mycena vulgaris]
MDNSIDPPSPPTLDTQTTRQLNSPTSTALMESHSPRKSPDPPTATDLVTRADGILRDCMAESSIANLNTAIYLLAQTWGDYIPQDSQYLNLLATALLTRFSYTGNWEDVQFAGTICAKLFTGTTSDTLKIHNIVNGVCDFLLYLICILGKLGLHGFQLDGLQVDENLADIVKLAGNTVADIHQSVNLTNLATAISFYEQALSAQDSLGSHASRALRQLANAHLIQFRTTRNTDGVRKSISLGRQLHRVQPNQVSCLCAALLSEVEITNVLEAMKLIQEGMKSDVGALEVAVTGATEFLKASIRPGDGLNLGMAISALQAAADQVTWGHPERPAILSSWGNALCERFERTGDSADLGVAIGLHREALDLRPAPDPDRSDSLSNLADVLYERFEAGGHAGDLDDAIELYREALDLCPPPHPDHDYYIKNLAHRLHERFETRGDAADLDNVIELYREGLDLCLPPYPDRGSSPNSLANVLHEQFQRRGDAADLDDVIGLHHESLHLCPPPHPDRGSSLNSLANVLHERFQIRGAAADLDDAIELHREALDMCPPPHPNRGNTLNNLASVLHERFQKRGDATDLDDAIALHREALDVHPATHPNHHRSLHSLADVLHEQFQKRGDAADLDDAIGLHHESLHMCPPPHPDRGSSLNSLANGLYERFQIRGAAADLDDAIELHREALDMCPPPHPNRGNTLNNLASVLHERFQKRGDATDLDDAIALHREALDVHPATHPNHQSSLHNLAIVLCERFQKRGDAADLDDAIELQREALNLQPALHPNRGNTLNNLANVLHERFQERYDAADLDDAIELHREALDLHPTSHLNRGGSLYNLANVLHERFLKRGAAADLDDAIELHREALDMRPPPHPNRGNSLNNLANMLHERFHTRGDAADLDDAVGLHYESLHLCPPPHPDRGSSLNNLANGLYERFQKRGDAADLDHAISLHGEALNLRLTPHPSRGNSLNNLANMLYERFQRRGDAADVDNAIELHREALDLHPPHHAEHGNSLNNLANVLHERFQRRGDAADLDNAIELHREALNLRPAPHPDRGDSLNNLANGLLVRFETRGDAADLENAVGIHLESLHLCPPPHPDRDSSLNNLANVLHAQFETRGDAANLDNAIELYRESLDLRPSPHPDRASSLNNLANVLHQRFQTRGDAADLDSAIRMRHEALAVCQPPHPHRGLVLMSLGTTLIEKHDNSLDFNIMEEAVLAYRESSGYLPSPVSARFRAAARWAQHAEKRNHSSALEGYEKSIDLLPQHAMLGLDIQSRQKALKLSSTVGLASDAAAYASQNNEIGKAVEFLEAGRSVFWSQAVQLHASVDDLHKVHSELAARISNISKQLVLGSHRNVAAMRMLPGRHKNHIMLDKDDAHYRKLNAEWIQALDEVRQQPGFQRFLRPKLMNELRAAAIHGPIVILNTSKSTCTAFIVTLSRAVQAINLANMSWDRAQLLVDLLRALLSRSHVQIIQTLTKIPMQEVARTFPTLQERLKGSVENSEDLNPNKIFGWLLGEIWTVIVQPIFHALKLKKSDHLSRLWWCPTGPFTFLPIHAAGIYGPLGTDCVSDYVVSSYTPTMATLLNHPTQTASPFKMTALIQPTTDNCSDLPGTVEELARIRQQVPSQWLTSLGDATPATVDGALHHLQESLIVHFACHGTQDLKNPLETGLHLTDGRLKVSELMRGKSQKQSMSLAFLSACETAKGDETVPDEAMHLAATLLFAGFRGVVATMWTMADPDGPKIAGSFYEHLFKGCDANANPPILPDLTKAAEALHIAIAKLRADPNVPFSRWVPFVHYGL